MITALLEPVLASNTDDGSHVGLCGSTTLDRTEEVATRISIHLLEDLSLPTFQCLRFVQIIYHLMDPTSLKPYLSSPPLLSLPLSLMLPPSPPPPCHAVALQVAPLPPTPSPRGDVPPPMDRRHHRHRSRAPWRVATTAYEAPTQQHRRRLLAGEDARRRRRLNILDSTLSTLCL